MAKAKTHDKLIISTTPIITILFYIIVEYINVTPTYYVPLMSFTYIFGGLLLSPDLDIKSAPFTKWGIIKFIWIPYQRIVKHRSILSHGILIGTALRILYLVLIIGSIFTMFTPMTIIEFLDKVLLLLRNNEIYSISIFVALELSAIVHIVADKISTFSKKKYFFGYSLNNIT